MDILHPTAPALPHKEATHGQAAIDDAEKTLSDFKKISKELNEEATKLHKAAKDLVREVLYNIEQGQAKVNKAEWSGPEFSACKQNVLQKQEKAWDALEANGNAVKDKLEGPYKFVLASKDNIVRARGDSVTGGLFGSVSADQKQVRKIFDHKLKHGFEDAAAAHAAITSYPDGLVTQIHLLRKQALTHLGVESK